MTISIEVPGSSATVHDLHAPMIIGARDCERKCGGSRHDHAAKHSTEEGEFHFNSFRSVCNRSSPSIRSCPLSIYCEPGHGTLPAWPCAAIARPAQAPKLCYDVTNVTARGDLTIQLRTFFVDWLSNDSRFKISEPNIPIMTFEVCSKLSESTKQNISDCPVGN